MGDIVERVTRKNYLLESSLPLTISAQDGLIAQNEFFDKQVASKNIRGYYLIRKGEFAYNKSYSNGYPWGAIKRLDNYLDGVLSTLYIVFKPININSQYLVSYFNANYWHKEVASIAVEGARNHGLLNIPVNDFFNISISLPKSKEEQTAIGNFFKQLDDTIALHQRTLKKYQKLKISYLEKMFPKENEQFPELRFPNFTDAWEQRKLGEIAEIRRGASPRPIQDGRWFNKNSEIGWLRISDVTEQNGRIQFIEQRLSKEGQEKTLVLDSPHLILSIAATVGKPVINFVPTGIHDGFIVFINLKADMEFMFQWLEIFRPNWQKLGQSGSQININSELVREQKILLPISIEEQTAIGNFFKQLDETIALHQREVEKYKKIKQAYLEKMFI